MSCLIMLRTLHSQRLGRKDKVMEPIRVLALPVVALASIGLLTYMFPGKSVQAVLNRQKFRLLHLPMFGAFIVWFYLPLFLHVHPFIDAVILVLLCSLSAKLGFHVLSRHEGLGLTKRSIEDSIEHRNRMRER